MGWKEDLKGLAKYADTLEEFARDPVDFLREHVLQIIAESFISLVLEGVGLINSLFSTLLGDVFGSAGQAVLGSFAVVGSVPLLVIGIINDLLKGLASVGGPAAPVIYAVLWAVVLVVTVELGYRALVILLKSILSRG